MTEIIKGNYTYENLEVGQIYKSYRQLCEALGAKVEGGNSKKSQLSEWKCHFAYRKQGNKFIIDEIYENPLVKVETRGRPSVYGNMVQLLILDLLGKSHGSIIISANKLMEVVGMTNENYGKCQDKALGLASYSGMDIGHVYDFYNTTNSGLRGVIDTALKNLKDKLIVDYSKVTKVKEIGSVMPRLATDEEAELLMTISKDILNEMGFEKISEVRRSSKWGDYLKRQKEELSEQTNFEFHYKAYKIIINKKHLETEKTKLTALILEDEIYNKERSELNDLVIKNTISNAKTRAENIDDKTSERLLELRSKGSYVSNITTLCDLTINKDKSSIYEKVHNRQLEILEEINARKQEK